MQSAMVPVNITPLLTGERGPTPLPRTTWMLMPFSILATCVGHVRSSLVGQVHSSMCTRSALLGNCKEIESQVFYSRASSITFLFQPFKFCDGFEVNSFNRATQSGRRYTERSVETHSRSWDPRFVSGPLCFESAPDTRVNSAQTNL